MTPALYANDTLLASVRELSIVPEDQLLPLYEQSKHSSLPLGELLVENELVTDENMGRIIAELIGLPFVLVSEISLDPQVLQIIPQPMAKAQKVIAFKKDKDGLHVASSQPIQPDTQYFLRKKAGMPILVYYATEHDIQKALLAYAKNVALAFEALIHKPGEPPIIDIVQYILVSAYQNKASDVHIEPQKETALVRYRIDGILHDIVSMPVELHPKIVTRIKVLSRLRTDEHQAPQDGKLQFLADGEEVDVRVSIVPVTTGEKVVMRLLAAKSRRISLTDIGLSGSDLAKVRSAYHKPYGMILATGPTGSGKTTSMYAILKLLNHREVNIMTIEDPVEYELEGVSQIQVNPKTNLTFAEGLRSIVRQDPNIILVGEIRDQETASIAVNAAMTGHLVLSTLHTNDAATAIPRLMDMGMEPFLVASSVNVIVAQRLVRNIHTGCRVSKEVPLADILKQLNSPLITQILGDKEHVRLYEGKGCAMCHGTGYEGRIGIFEVMVVDEEIRQAIVTSKTAAEIEAIAKKNGMITMIEDGLEKVKDGRTTIGEVIRVTKE